jgi:hypothetical protein
VTCRRHGEIKNAFFSENLKGSEHLGDADVEGRIILKWVLKNRV